MRIESLRLSPFVLILNEKFRICKLLALFVSVEAGKLRVFRGEGAFGKVSKGLL